jgi:hypothetical protein
VESTLIYSEGITRFRDDTEKLSEFLRQLHEAKVLDADEVTNGLAAKSGPAASKMKKISEHADVILDNRILPLLSPGYSLLYELALLMEQLRLRQRGIADLHTMLLSSNGPITRAWVKSKRTALQKDVPTKDSGHKPDVGFGSSHAPIKNLSAQEAPPLQPQMDDGQSAGNSSPVAEPIQPPEAVKSLIAVMLLTPTSRDISKLEKALDDNASAPCLAMRDEIDQRAVLLVRTKVSTLLSLSMSNVIDGYGFGRCVRIGLISDPTNNDITSSEVMAIYIRGGLKIEFESIDWRSDKNTSSLADRILEGIDGRRMHLFAKERSDSWETAIGDENWQGAK